PREVFEGLGPGLAVEPGEVGLEDRPRTVLLAGRAEQTRQVATVLDIPRVVVAECGTDTRDSTFEQLDGLGVTARRVERTGKASLDVCRRGMVRAERGEA